VGKRYVLHILNVCVCVAVVRHHANPVHHVVLLSVTCGFVFFYKTLCETFLILRIIQRGTAKSLLYMAIHVKYLLFFSYFI
jgi:hypothetical protein